MIYISDAIEVLGDLHLEEGIFLLVWFITIEVVLGDGHALDQRV